ncbi:MAG: NnrS family protein [Marinobacter sp.]|nr:NnrS family protein [Marinobacter sp.]
MTESRGARPIFAFWFFFPAAAAWAALAVPLSLLGPLSGEGWVPGLIGTGHGHEMIFGFALAVIAGYTLGPQPVSVLLLLAGVWLLARSAWLIAPETTIAQILSPAFALLLAHYAVPRFSAAKKWRNRIAGPLILLLCLLPIGFWLTDTNTAANYPGPDTHQLMQAGVVGLLLLMAFMGGRILAPAVAGTLEKKGIPLTARVQPRIEGALLVLLSAAFLLSLGAVLPELAATCLMASAALIIIRMGRWRLWRCPERPDLLMLGLGYGWLAVGSGCLGVALAMGEASVPALHLITIGGLGTLSTGVMLRLTWQRAHRRPPPHWQVLGLAGLIGGAAVCRFLAGPHPFNAPSLLWASATLWSIAFTGVAVQTIRLIQPAHLRRK